MAIDITNLEYRQAAQLAAHYLGRGYVNATAKQAQRDHAADLPALVRAEIQVRMPHFTDRQLDEVMSWGQAAVNFRDMARQAMQQAAHLACGSADACLWDMDDVQRQAYMDALDKLDVHEMQRRAGIPVDAIMAMEDERDPGMEG